MKVERKGYYILRPRKPIVFHAGDGVLSEYIEDAEIYNIKEAAENELSNFDEPEHFDIGEASVTFSI